MQRNKNCELRNTWYLQSIGPRAAQRVNLSPAAAFSSKSFEKLKSCLNPRSVLSRDGLLAAVAMPVLGLPPDQRPASP